MHVTDFFLENGVPGLSGLLDRLRSLCPTADTQTHILHLASNGEILPHIDNLQASGTWILGVSLGAERIMRMEGTGGNENVFDVLLPSGSVYLQR
jgi:alkylated DNA repair protein alkB family protein 7